MQKYEYFTNCDILLSYTTTIYLNYFEALLYFFFIFLHTFGKFTEKNLVLTKFKILSRPNKRSKFVLGYSLNDIYMFS